jgi:hypothetical protein
VSDISFDKVEAATPAACAVCKGSLAPQYFSVNGTPICASCRARVDQQLVRGPLLPRLLLACAIGGVVAIGGAVLSHAITAATGYSFALVTIVVGMVLGGAMRRVTRGGGRGWQLLAVFFTYASFSLATLPMIRDGLLKDGGSEIAATIVAFILCWVTPVFVLMDSVASGLLNLLILAFGLHAAWRALADVKVDITGPFAASAPAASDAPPSAPAP